MGNINQIELPNNQTYDIEDTTARSTFTQYRRLDDPYYDEIYVTELNSGNIVNTGAARFLNTINGSISGNAATATKATQDSDGSVINTTYLKKSGGTMIGALHVSNTGKLIFDWTSGTDCAMFVLKDAENYGIHYQEGNTDTMKFSASGNAHTNNADLCINGAGDGTVTIRGNTIIHAGNYTSYTVKKDGTGASGTWGISITGNAATATKATQDGNGNVISSTYVKVTGDPTIFKVSDIAEGAANLSTQATAHRVTVYRNGMTIPYQMDNANDGGMIRVRGTSENDCIFELGTWDDSGAGETIQFNYYPTTSQVTPTYSVVVPKKSGTIMLTNDTYSGTLTKAQVTTALGYTPPTSDTNYYHTTGSWSGLTYTATANGGAGALAFTIPTGTSATTVAVGNHNHNGTYVKVAGDSMTGTLCMNSTNGNYGEGIRINAGNGGYSSFTLGTAANSTSGISDCGFWIGTNITNATYQRKLYIAHNSSTASGTYFYASSATQYSPNLRIGSDLLVVGTTYVNASSSGTSAGIALYGTSAPTSYGITMRGTATSSGQLGKHGYVQGDWAGYLCFDGAVNRGYIFRQAGNNIASISGEGHAVFNGSVTVGGNATNTSGVRQVYNSTTQSLDFVFVA